ncbi:preprotein translocase subunit SecG [Candidatus Falkowbacteria bacterium]|nr:preprotein translocase subunit SecG [Candidatus Falkowbacteria bacterium]MBT4439406.1 preprotein translocase subunit SecG [Elusimicrobiaceae bacterium]
MSKFFTILQLVSALLLVVTILMQQRGSGLSGLFGGSGDVYRSKRGAEKMLFITTIVLAVLFLGSGVANLIF